MGFRQPLTRLSELLADSIIGAVIKTAATGARIELNTAAANVIRFFSGDPAELDASTLSSYASSGEAGIELRSASVDIGGGVPSARAHLLLAADVAGTRALIEVDNIELTANDTVTLTAANVVVSAPLDIHAGLWEFGVPYDTGWVTFALNVPNVPMTINFARYRRVGRTCFVRASITLTAGIGPALIDLPLPFRVGTLINDSHLLGHVRAVRSGVAWFQGDVTPQQLTGPPRATIYQATGSGAQWSAASPAAWAAGDRWGFDFSYECTP